MATQLPFNLLTVKGKTKTDSVESTRQLHNQTAGHPDGVAAAKALGDMSHMIFMPAESADKFIPELLFLDICVNLEGMQQFFSDKQVQGGAAMMFESREAIVWTKLGAFINFDLMAPTGMNKRIVGIIQGKVESIEKAQKIHNESTAKTAAAMRNNGIISHNFYVRAAEPGSSEVLEILGVDVWMSAQGMGNFYGSSEFRESGIHAMFSEKPATSTWTHPGGEWVEW